MRKRLSGAGRRQALLDVATAVAAEHGMGGVNMAVIARRAGVTRPVVYDHFATREELLIALIEGHHAAFMERLAGIDLGEGLEADTGRRLLEHYYAQVAADPAGWSVLCLERSAHPAIAAVQQRTALQLDELLAAQLAIPGTPLRRRLIAGALRAAVNEIARLGEGKVSPDELADAAMTFLAPLSGADA